MTVNCKYVGTFLGLVIIVFALWQTGASQWIIIIAAALLVWHALTCKTCNVNVSSAKKGKK